MPSVCQYSVPPTRVVAIFEKLCLELGGLKKYPFLTIIDFS